MTIECVDGQMATPHITGAQKGAIHAGVFGSGSYVLATGNQCKATQNSATSVTVGTGDLIIHGRHHQIVSAETVTIQSGTQGQKRNDLICAVYHRNAQGIEQPTVTVLKGTPTTGTPADPTVPSGNVLNGDAVDYFPLYRVSLNGTTASAPVRLFRVSPTLASLGESVSQDLLHRPTCVLTTTVPGWHGDVIVTTNQYNDEANRWEYDRGSFFQLRLWLWSYNLRDEPWTNAVQPPNNPFESDAWCAKVPIKVTDGSFEEVVRNVALISVADSGGYLTYQRTYIGHLFLARDGYPYVFVGKKDIFAEAAGSVRIDTTVFNPRFHS